MKICPNCHHKPSEDEIKFSPQSCIKCGSLFSALELINERKRQNNENLKPWRITRWRPKYGTGLFLGVPVAMVVMFTVYYIGQIIIANSRPISNEMYRLTKSESIAPIKAESLKKQKGSSQISQKDDRNITIVSQKNITAIFIDQENNIKHGPFVITANKAERINLNNGDYIVKVIKEGKTYLITVKINDQIDIINL